MEDDKIFSDEYSSEDTNINTAKPIASAATNIPGEDETYTISKPRRVIIKAIIKND